MGIISSLCNSMRGSCKDLSISETLTSKGIETQVGISILSRSLNRACISSCIFSKYSPYNSRSSSCKSLLTEAKQGNCSNARRLILFLYNCNFLRKAAIALLLDIRSNLQLLHNPTTSEVKELDLHLTVGYGTHHYQQK